MQSSKIRRISSLLLMGFLLLAVGFAGGCGQASEQDEAGTPSEQQVQEADKLSGTITIAGSTSVQPFSEVLAEEFMKKHPQVQVNVQGGGSSQGVQAAISGAADIGSASRDLKDEEKAKNLLETKLALDGVAIVAHPSNKLNELTMEDVKNIYIGNISNWKDIGGEDAKITVVCREDGSGTRGAFEDIVMNKEEISDKVIIQNSNGAVRTTVAGDKNAIGFISLAIVNDEVKALDIEGVAASVENIKSGSYKISRPFLYLTKTQTEGIVKAYLDFVLSDEGQAIVSEEGAITVK